MWRSLSMLNNGLIDLFWFKKLIERYFLQSESLTKILYDLKNLRLTLGFCQGIELLKC